MVKLQYTGQSIYRGVDSQSGMLLIVMPGDTVQVSSAKARQLLADFPDQWQVLDTTPSRNKLGRPARKKRQPRRQEHSRGR